MKDEEQHDMFRQVPVLPVVFPVAVVVFLGLLWSLQRRNRLSLPRAALAAVLCVYLAGVIANTVFPIFLDKPSHDAPWSTFLNVVPIVGYDIADAAMNVAIFIPVGMMVPLVLTRPSWRRVVGVATAFSLTIEVTQYVTAHTLGGGHVADVNDLLSNAAGGALGFGLVSLLERASAVRSFIDRFRWR